MDAVRDTDAAHIVELHGPKNIYVDSQGDGRGAWKDLIIWMEHPQRILLISTALEKQLRKLSASSGRTGHSMGMYIAQFNKIMVEHQRAARDGGWTNQMYLNLFIRQIMDNRYETIVRDQRRNKA